MLKTRTIFQKQRQKLVLLTHHLELPDADYDENWQCRGFFNFENEILGKATKIVEHKITYLNIYLRDE